MSASIVADRIGLALPSQQQDDHAAGSWWRQVWQSVVDNGHREDVQVLSDISFEARTGDRIGIMGLNGAGKTTLLRTLNGVFPPTSGRLQVQGRVQSLLNTSLGFNPYATVRENIYLRGTAMGLSYREIGQQVESVLDFSGLREKAGHRLHTLSSGQNTRLGFAISTAIQPDIMLMDEWIGAGDETFVTKAKERLLGRLHASEIVILASHNARLLKEMCNKGIVLDRGRLLHFGDFDEAFEAYQRVVHAERNPFNRAGTSFSTGAEGGALGVVEHIELQDGALRISGWAVGSDGGPAAVLVVDLEGRAVVQASFERTTRKDVREHLGVQAENLGFRVTVALQQGEDAEGLAHALQISGGNAPTRLGAVFHKPLPRIDDRRARLKGENA